jgi:hypothetical protein
VEARSPDLQCEPRATNDDRGEEFPDAELDRLYALYNGRDADGGPAGFGIQARDKLIRQLIEEVRRLARN